MKKLALIAAVLLLAPGVAAAADLTGAWTVSTNVNDMPFTIICNLTQTGAVLGGSCGVKDAPDKPSVLTGAVDGDSAKWTYDVTFQDMRCTSPSWRPGAAMTEPSGSSHAQPVHRGSVGTGRAQAAVVLRGQAALKR